MALLRSIRRLVVATVVFGLIALNILTVTSVTVAAAMAGLVSVLAPGMATVGGELARTKADLRATKADLDTKNKRLAAIDSRGAARKAAIAQRTKTIAGRTKRGAARNLASIAGESVPFYGIAVVVGVTALEIADACATLEDMAAISREFELEGPVAETTTVCTMEVPTAEDVTETLQAGPGVVLDRLAEQVPEVSLPDWAADFSWRSIVDRMLDIIPKGTLGDLVTEMRAEAASPETGAAPAE